ncbi:MAG: DUF423 domain-containing protein [Bacteroidales bacterium]|nr:DUF423 domain-containing protein [Bacteroidales bacterium]
MTKNLLITGSILAGLSVALGALGAHWLKQNLSPAALTSFQTGVQYQMYHALAILIMAALPTRFHVRLFRIAFFAFLTGVIFFSGSIYLLSTREITGWTWSWMGPVTPLGGLMFIAGWILLIFTAVRVKAEAGS